MTTCFVCCYIATITEWAREMHMARSIHGTIIRTGITCKKIPCYMRDSASRWLVVENAYNFEVMLNIKESSFQLLFLTF